MRTRNKKEKKVFYPFTYTHHSPEMLMKEYEDYYININNKYKEVVEYIKQLPYFERVIFLLYCEYNSYRLVSEETNVKYQCIFNSIKEIKVNIFDILKRNEKV